MVGPLPRWPRPWMWRWAPCTGLSSAGTAQAFRSMDFATNETKVEAALGLSRTLLHPMAQDIRLAEAQPRQKKFARGRRGLVGPPVTATPPAPLWMASRVLTTARKWTPGVALNMRVNELIAHGGMDFRTPRTTSPGMFVLPLDGPVAGSFQTPDKFVKGGGKVDHVGGSTG